MLSKTPIDQLKVRPDATEKEILRLGIIAEIDATSLYEQLAATSKDARVKALMLDVAKEEKTHTGEFLALLLELDKEQLTELERGRVEMMNITARGSRK
jgi:rubrerythrin